MLCKTLKEKIIKYLKITFIRKSTMAIQVLIIKKSGIF